MMTFFASKLRRKTSWALLLAVFLAAGAVAQNCVPPPIALPIKNVTLSTGKIQRGVFLTVGEPEQSFAFLPYWQVNNTFLYGPACDSLNLTWEGDSCVTFRGGVYKPADSTTKGGPPSSFKPPTEPWSSKTYKFFSDKFNVASNVSLDNFVFANPVDYTGWDLQGYDPLNMIGMDKGSTLMSALRSTGRIASSAFGFWWGLDGVEDDDQQQGSFVLGGYDKAKTYGDGATMLLSHHPDCPTSMMVTIQDITLNLSNGTDASVFSKENGGTALLACVVPQRATLMDMPRFPYFDNLLNVIGNSEAGRSTGIDWWTVIMDPSLGIYNGGITFKLGGGISIKIPNHQLVVPERKIDQNGNLYANASRPVIRINSLQNTTANVLPILGRYFLTGAYLMGNSGAGKFTIWQANPTTDQSLVAVNDGNEVFDPSKTCATTPTASLSPNGAAGGTDKASGSSGNSTLSSGAVAGIAVGAAVVALACAASIWLFVRKRRASSAQQQGRRPEDAVQEPKSDGEAAYPAQGTPHFIPQELPAVGREDPPIEMPG